MRRSLMGQCLMHGLAASVVVVLMAPLGWALDASQTGKAVTLRYAEPSTSADGSALNDLMEVLVRWDADGVVQQEFRIPASSITGGATIDHIMDVSVLPNRESTLTFKLFAVDLVGNVSEEALLVKSFDWLPPGKVR